MLARKHIRTTGPNLEPWPFYQLMVSHGEVLVECWKVSMNFKAAEKVIAQKHMTKLSTQGVKNPSDLCFSLIFSV